MTLRSYLAGMMASTIFCWLAWGLVLYYVNPQEANLIGFLSFYLSLFFASVGTLTLIGFYLRVWFSKNEVLFSHVNPAFRQAILLSIILIVSLILQSFRILTWWDGGLLIASVALLEFYFMSR